MKISKSAPTLRSPLSAAECEADDGETTRSLAVSPSCERGQPVKIPAIAASWLPALRPLTGCAGCSKMNALDSSLSANARSWRVLNRNYNSEVASVVCSSRYSQKQGETTESASPSSRRSPSPSARGKEGRVLTSCTSPPVDRENYRSCVSLRLLESAPHPGRARASRVLRSRSLLSGASSGMLADLQELAKCTGELEATLAEITSSHDVWDPRDPKGKSIMRSSRCNISFVRNDTDHWQEKFRAYKMVRRIEPPLPPLNRNLCEEMPRRVMPGNNFIDRNASVAALRRWYPDSRLNRIMEKKDEQAERMRKVRQRYNGMVGATTQRYADELNDKKRRAEISLSDQKQGGMHRPAKMRAFGEQWFVALMTALFMSRVHSGTKASRDKIDNAVKMGLMADDDCLGVDTDDKPRKKTHLRVSICVLQAKIKILFQRKRARKMYGMLSQWKTSGRIVLALRRVVVSIKMLQTWWRQRRVKLLEMREKVSIRWQHIEREQLLREHTRRKFAGSSGSTSPSKGSRKTQEFADLSPDVYVSCFQVPSNVRLNFLDHELRARRFMLLPKLNLWEEECARWGTNFISKIEDSMAMKVMGVDDEELHHQRVAYLVDSPPVCPSYMPPAHPPMPRDTHRCTEDCCGRQGDTEILEMWRRCRESWSSRGHGGWLLIRSASMRRNKTAKRSGGIERSKATTGRVQGQEFGQNSDFHDVTDADLLAWGIDGRDLPGLIDGAERAEPPPPC